MRDRNKRRKYNKEYKATFRLSKVGVLVSLFSLVLVLGLLFLSQSNQMATSGYDIAKLQKDANELKSQNEQLQIQASRLQSIQNIDGGIKNSGMVPVGQINYLPGNTNVATSIK